VVISFTPRVRAAAPGLAILAVRCDVDVRRIERDDEDDTSTIVSSSETIASPLLPVRGEGDKGRFIVVSGNRGVDPF
jgi:hypothetical protein